MRSVLARCFLYGVTLRQLYLDGSDRSGFGTFFGSKLMIVRSLVDVDFLSYLRNMSNEARDANYFIPLDI